MTESSVELNVEGTGPKVRTTKLTTSTAVDSAGAAQADTVTHQQVVSLADQHGDLADDPNRLLAGILDAQTRTNELLELLLGRLS